MYNGKSSEPTTLTSSHSCGNGRGQLAQELHTSQRINVYFRPILLSHEPAFSAVIASRNGDENETESESEMHVGRFRSIYII